MKISIIVSVYNEEQVLHTFYHTLIKVLEEQKYEYEIIFVNDGSSDSSQDIIDNFISENSNVKSILFSRNFGHEAAMIAGIDHVTGKMIICMDSDLQHPPAIIPEIYNRFVMGNVDIINMVRKELRQNLTSKLFYQILNLISPYNFEANASDFFVISERIAKILRDNYRERVRFLRGFIQIMGFKRTTLDFIAPERKEGKSKYSFSKLLSFYVFLILDSFKDLSRLIIGIHILPNFDGVISMTNFFNLFNIGAL